MDAVATGARADGKQDVAHAMGGRLDEILLLQDADAHRVDERVPGVARGEVHFSAERRHAHAVAVVADAADDTSEQIAVARLVEGAKPEAVEQRDGTRAHRKDVAEDAARAGRRPLVGFDGRWMVMRLDLECDRPSARQPQHAGVFTGTLDDLGTGRGECLEDRPRMLVGAMLAP